MRTEIIGAVESAKVEHDGGGYYVKFPDGTCWGYHRLNDAKRIVENYNQSMIQLWTLHSELKARASA